MKAFIIFSKTPSAPLSIKMLFGLVSVFLSTKRTELIIFLKSFPVGSGYNLNLSLIAILISSKITRGGGYGFSFMFNLIHPASDGCSSGIYCSILSKSSLSKFSKSIYNATIF